jgi:hypothetical protein
VVSVGGGKLLAWSLFPAISTGYEDAARVAPVAFYSVPGKRDGLAVALPSAENPELVSGW